MTASGFIVHARDLPHDQACLMARPDPASKASSWIAATCALSPAVFDSWVEHTQPVE